MAEGGEAAEVADVVAAPDEHALTIQLKGARFEGGRLPLSALGTLTKMEAMVRAIARDLEVSARDDAARASRYAKVELVLVGEIEEGSALFRLLIAPVFLAASGPSHVSQSQLLESLTERVPAIVQAVHDGTEVPSSVTAGTRRLVAELGQQLGAGEELVLRPDDGGALAAAVDDKSATVTRASALGALEVQDASTPSSFFVTGTIRQVENHGEDPGRLTLATTAGLYPVPGASVQMVEQAAAALGANRNTILAISGQGVLDGKGRLKSLTHVTQMRSVDRHFNPERRFAELIALAPSDLVRTRIRTARTSIERAVLATGRAPGLFLDEDDQLEARWLVRRSPEAPAHVVSASFGSTIEVYIFDRSADEVVHEASFGADDVSPGDLIANVIEMAVGDVDG